jgi:Family of unknown function (DUF6262)
MTETTSPLTMAVRARSLDTRIRATDALRRVDAAGAPISFSSVANAAMVSRSWLYRDHDLRGEIKRLRARSTMPAPSSSQRRSARSEQRRREALSDEIARLKEENATLRDEVARTLGRHRALHV